MWLLARIGHKTLTAVMRRDRSLCSKRSVVFYDWFAKLPLEAGPVLSVVAAPLLLKPCRCGKKP